MFCAIHVIRLFHPYLILLISIFIILSRTFKFVFILKNKIKLLKNAKVVIKLKLAHPKKSQFNASNKILKRIKTKAFFKYNDSYLV